MTTKPGHTIGSTGGWHAAFVVALDLEGSGAQDRDREAILEIALMPLAACRAPSSTRRHDAGTFVSRVYPKIFLEGLYGLM